LPIPALLPAQFLPHDSFLRVRLPSRLSSPELGRFRVSIVTRNAENFSSRGRNVGFLVPKASIGREFSFFLAVAIPYSIGMRRFIQGPAISAKITEKSRNGRFFPYSARLTIAAFQSEGASSEVGVRCNVLLCAIVTDHLTR
jgi:hypothetical protein